MNDLLDALKEVEGVIGACALDRNGGLLGRSLPAYYDDDMLVQLNRRFEELFESSEEILPQPKVVIAQFSQTWLLGRDWPGGRLILFCGPQAHVPAVKTAASLTAKRLGKSLASPAPATPKPAARVAPAPASLQRPIPGKQQKTRSGIWG